MESLIIFLIFIVFSVLKSLGGQPQRPGHAPGRPGHYPGLPQERPVRPARPVPPLYRPDVLPPEYADLYLNRETPRKTEPVREVPEEAPRPPVRPDPVLLEPDEEQLFDLDARSLLQSVVLAEVLGPPRAKQPRSIR